MATVTFGSRAWLVRGVGLASALALSLSLAGCKIRMLTFGGDIDALGAFRPEVAPPGDAEPEEDLRDADNDRVQNAGDARGGCSPQPEICNGIDDDCNGLVDDGFDLTTDSNNCGRCGVTCGFPNAAAACMIGRCRLGGCQAGFVDLDLVPLNGCECQISNGGVEICDGKDNDCNGRVDESFDLEASITDCGMCGRICKYDHAAALCMRGQCRLGACADGFVDLDGNAGNGCEYACSRNNGGIEICDGKDNDCNGVIDEGDPRVGMRCFPDGMMGCDATTGRCGGACALGLFACRPGGLTCLGATLPKTEICNGQDDDCDNAIDEDYDLQNDPRWCGACGKACELPNAVPGCKEARCTVKSCRSGFVDLDGLADNGCEYACTADGPEVCDGKDNDCDGKFDTDDADLLYPAMNFCRQVGECGNGPGGSTRYTEKTFPLCVTPPGAARPDWICNYPDSVQLSAPNQIQGEETFCDGKDNDCDGLLDEHAKIGDKCMDNGAGQCRKTGKLVCQADRTLTPLCDVSLVANYTPIDEICDGKDNDCDGLIDESWDTPPGLGYTTCSGADCRGVTDDLINVTVGGRNYYIYKYESTRADATADDQGSKEARSCSRKPADGALRPWTGVSFAQAKLACAGAGMRLCRTKRKDACASTAISEDEWGLACTAGLTCSGGVARLYPYECSYDAQICNGQDTAKLTDVATGSLARCVTPDLDTAAAGDQQAYDMSGNLAEWTDDCRGTLNDGTGRKAYTLRGGGFNSIPLALRCDFMALVVAENFSFNDTGFRCCSSCARGLADCGACVNLGSDGANCGACGNACPAGQSCSNGVCR